jgi:hypothetical protein
MTSLIFVCNISYKIKRIIYENYLIFLKKRESPSKRRRLSYPALMSFVVQAEASKQAYCSPVLCELYQAFNRLHL